MIGSLSVRQPTCILVLMTSRGVFPNTLAAPAKAPNSPVITGLMALLGSSPWKTTKMSLSVHLLFNGFSDSLTFVPVPQ